MLATCQRVERMTTDNDESAEPELRNLRIELMKAEIDHHRLDMRKLEQDLRWEPWKALAAFLAAAAAFGGAVLGLAVWLSQHPHIFGG
jgi:phytoene/squalene synthetase